MARKSAAQVKTINTRKNFKQPELPPIEETFGNIKQVMINTAEVQVVVAGRVENLINLRAAAYKFWGNMLDSEMIMRERMEYYKQLQQKTIEVYKNILDIVKTFELEEFCKEDMKDYFADLMPKADEVTSEKELFEAGLVADCIKPWGEKMSQLHHQMLDEVGQRKAMEPEKPEE